MAREERREIEVHADWKGLDGPLRMGILYAERVRGKELFSFEYDEEWLRSPQALKLDPELALYSGPQYLQDERKPNFGLFLDTAPDRWGKLLMKRKELAEARLEGREARSLFETDYLLGVSDQLRMGAIRFKEDPDSPFLSDDRDRSIPPWTSLRELEESSLSLESEEAMEDPAYLLHLQKLLAPGSSLGGARPKASVSDPEGGLWVAKFPSRKDEFDVGAWEMLVHELARGSGIRSTNARAEILSRGQHTFLSQRFDRTPDQERIHFASAMTLLGYTDGEGHQEGASYLELAEFIMKHGANVQADLEELWRRIVLNICVSNCDDHLRNHGFLLTPDGWTLSPAYDLNPDPEGKGLSLNIDEQENALDLELAMEVRSYFRLSENRALEILKGVREAVGNWRKVAERMGMSRQERELMGKAFEKG